MGVITPIFKDCNTRADVLTNLKIGSMEPLLPQNERQTRASPSPRVGRNPGNRVDALSGPPEQTGEASYMSSEVQEPDRNRSAAGHAPVQWMSIPDAALLLGISERAVFKRCRSGTLTRRSAPGGRVEVGVTTAKPVQEPSAEVPAQDRNSSGTEQDPGSQVVQNGLQALVDHQGEEIRFLRSRLEASDVEKSELRRLMMADKNELQELRRKVSLLTSAPAESTVQSSDVAHTDTLPEEAGIHTSETLEAAQVVDQIRPRRWWEVWK